MRLKTSLLIAAIGVGILVEAPGAGAQSQPKPKTFEPEIIVGNSDLLRTNYNLADERLTSYLQQSMLAVQQGHRTAIQHFRVWFRDFRNASRSASVSVAQEIIKLVFPDVFKAIFPGSGPMVGVIQKVVTGTLAVDKLMSMREGEVELFLDRLQAAEEERIALLLNAPKQFKADYPDQYSAATWEYLEMRLQNPASLPVETGTRRAEDATADQSDLPASVIEILNTMGVPPPGAATARRVTEGVLEGHIYAVMHRDPEWRAAWPYSERAYAQAHALRVIDKDANKARICEAMRSWTYFRIFPANECAPLLRR
jgi:hypothetical protein